MSTTTLSHMQKLRRRQSCFFFKLRYFDTQCLEDFHSKERENEPIPAQKRPFRTVYNSWLDSPMTQKNARFGQDKKTKHKSVSIHILPFSQNVWKQLIKIIFGHFTNVFYCCVGLTSFTSTRVIALLSKTEYRRLEWQTWKLLRLIRTRALHSSLRKVGVFENVLSAKNKWKKSQYLNGGQYPAMQYGPVSSRRYVVITMIIWGQTANWTYFDISARLLKLVSTYQGHG